ncbi:MAG: LysR family transcriptional regulator [Lysobacter sp.]|nr:LysR family transcriptional regulator [Lysobacter sp.]
MDRLQAIRVFLRVVDLGSFSKAAADVGIGQPSATKLVAQLEKGLGARLLHRSTHGVTPTEIGSLYYEKCKVIAHHVEEAQNVAALLQSELQGTLRITTSVAFGRRVLVPHVMQFMKLHPRLRVDLVFEDRYVNLVEQGIDVAIRMGRLGDSSLGARFLATNPWVVVAAPAYLQRRRAPRQPDDLRAHDALVYSTVQGDARWQFTGPGGREATVLVQGPMRSNNLSALLAAARGGMGIAALPWYVAHASVSSGALKPVLAKWSMPSQDIHAVYPSPRLVPAKVSRFVDWLRGRFGPAWWTEVK